MLFLDLEWNKKVSYNVKDFAITKNNGLFA